MEWSTKFEIEQSHHDDDDRSRLLIAFSVFNVQFR